MRKFRWAALAAAVAGALFAAGCSSGGGSASGPSVAAIKAAMRSASSVHISGSMTQSGKLVNIDLSMTRGGGLYGTMAVGGAKFTVLATGGQTYLKLSRSFLVNVARAPASTCKVVCGKYVKLPSSEAAAMLGSLTMTSLIDQMTKHPGTVTYQGKTTVDGQSAWVSHESDGTGYVAAKGKPYLLRLVGNSGSLYGQMEFTQWNSVTIPPPPPASEVVNPSKL